MYILIILILVILIPKAKMTSLRASRLGWNYKGFKSYSHSSLYVVVIQWTGKCDMHKKRKSRIKHKTTVVTTTSNFHINRHIRCHVTDTAISICNGCSFRTKLSLTMKCIYSFASPNINAHITRARDYGGDPCVARISCWCQIYEQLGLFF